MLEEIGSPYNVIPVDITNDEQFEPEFLKVSPNNKIPAIYDHDEGIALMKSGAILIYLAEKNAQFLPMQGEARARALEWLMFQMGGVGPMLGQVHYFVKYKPEVSPPAAERFSKEAQRLYGVLNNRLYDRRYIAGDQYTIADMACYPWTVGWEMQGQDINEFKYFKRWFEELGEREPLKKGMAAGGDLSVDYSTLTDADKDRIKAILFNQRARPAPDA